MITYALASLGIIYFMNGCGGGDSGGSSADSGGSSADSGGSSATSSLASETVRLQEYYKKASSNPAYQTIIEKVATPIGFPFGYSSSTTGALTAQVDITYAFSFAEQTGVDLDETAKHLYVEEINNKIETLAKEEGLE